MQAPDERGRFGEFGGRFVPEALMPACLELEIAFKDAWSDPAFIEEYNTVLRQFAGRPTPVTPLLRLSEKLGINVYAKREDLAHTGSHKINNVVGQTLLTKRMGKTRVIAETGAGQHGVATATAAARLGLECTVYMGEVDTIRQSLNVFRMELLGATVVPVTSGSKTLKDAVNEAMREWVTCVSDTHYCLGSVMGPHPFPWMVREMQSIIGHESSRQLIELGVATPDFVVACVGGGSNAAGIFSGFANTSARLIGVEAAGGAAVKNGSPGVLHGMRSMLIQSEFGQIDRLVHGHEHCQGPRRAAQHPQKRGFRLVGCPRIWKAILYSSHSIQTSQPSAPAAHLVTQRPSQPCKIYPAYFLNPH